MAKFTSTKWLANLEVINRPLIVLKFLCLWHPTHILLLLLLVFFFSLRWHHSGHCHIFGFFMKALILTICCFGLVSVIIILLLKIVSFAANSLLLLLLSGHFKDLSFGRLFVILGSEAIDQLSLATI